MGDGCASRTGAGNRIFKVEVIDIDFLEAVANAIYELFAYKPEIRMARKAKGNWQATYSILYCSSSFCDWLLDVTKNKTVIPDDILNGSQDLIKHFLVGLMDSEGCVSIRKAKDGSVNNHAVVRFLVMSDWCHDVRDLFQRMGTFPSRVYTRKDGALWFYIDTLMYFRKGFWFNIRRLQEKMMEGAQGTRIVHRGPRKKAAQEFRAAWKASRQESLRS